MARNKYPKETVQRIVEQAHVLFVQKGYDDTSIQDIINHLGGLSKGAIYHHFQSKEEIFEAVCRKIRDQNAAFYADIRDDSTHNGLEKLKIMMRSAYDNPGNKAMAGMRIKIVGDPRFFMNQIHEIFAIVAPLYVQPIVEEGIRDGSIQTDYPKELAEVMIVLLNIWVNPIIAKASAEEFRKKMEFLAHLFGALGIDLFDADTIKRYESLHQLYR